MKKFVKTLYDVPVLGYFVRLAVAVARLPESVPFHVARLDGLESRLHAMEQQSLSVGHEIGVAKRGAAEHARLLAELSSLTEKQRAERARLDADWSQRLQEQKDAFYHWLSRLLNKLALLDDPLPELMGKLKPVESQVNDLQREFLTRIGAVEEELAKRGAELERTADFLAGRIEFVRREALFEVKYGEPPEGSSERDLEPRILEPEKVREMAKNGYRLNVGCGHIPLDGYVNVDRRELPSVDMVAEADQMPFDEESVRELFSAHLVEHFPKEQLRRTVLPHWKALLRPGGILRAVAPDGEAMIDAYRNGVIAFEDYREVTYGAQDYDGDFHFNMFSQESLTELLEEAGFADVRFPATARRNGKCFELEVEARRPEAHERSSEGELETAEAN